jgi:hypothetical protein
MRCLEKTECRTKKNSKFSSSKVAFEDDYSIWLLRDPSDELTGCSRNLIFVGLVG